MDFVYDTIAAMHLQSLFELSVVIHIRTITNMVELSSIFLKNRMLTKQQWYNYYTSTPHAKARPLTKESHLLCMWMHWAVCVGLYAFDNRLLLGVIPLNKRSVFTIAVNHCCCHMGCVTEVKQIWIYLMEKNTCLLEHSEWRKYCCRVSGILCIYVSMKFCINCTRPNIYI